MQRRADCSGPRRRYDLAGFRAKEARFREKIDKLLRDLPDNTHDLKFPKPLERERTEMLTAVHSTLSAHAHRNRRQHAPPFLCRTVKVEFAGEPGEGSGVVRSFLAAVCEALVLPERLPSLPDPKAAASKKASRANVFQTVFAMDVDALPQPLDGGSSQLQAASAAMECDAMVPDTATAAAAAASGTTTTATVARAQPLFHSPGKPGYVTPVWVAGDGDSEVRLAWFRHTGTLVGLALVHNNMFPMTFARHVLKFLLGRDVGWHDLAFFDADMCVPPDSARPSKGLGGLCW